MLRLQRYLLRELITGFVLVLLIVTGIFLAASLLQIMQKAQDVSALAILKALPLFVALALPYTVPLSFLMACLLSYGRFADDNEFVAMQMGGISPWHAVAPAVFAAAVVSGGTLWLNTDMNPTLTSAKKEILRGQIREQIDLMSEPGRDRIKIADMEMSWAGRDEAGFQDVLLTWTTKQSDEKTGEKTSTTRRARARRATVAASAEPPVRVVVKLEDGSMPNEDEKGATTFEFRTSTIVIDVDDDDRSMSQKGSDEMRASELFYRVRRLELSLGRNTQSAEWRQYRRFASEYWRRIALGLSPLAFALLGVPLGLLVRRGSRMHALALAILVALPVYFPLLLLGDSLADKGVLPSALALNLGNLVLGAAGASMTARLITR